MADAQRRLIHDLTKVRREEDAGGLIGISAGPAGETDLRVWNAVILGPEDTCYEDGTFTLKMEFTDQYPIKPPTVRFTSKMFHPNVYADGSICLDILQRNWSPTYDVISILTSIRSLLNDPNPNSPANNEAAKLFVEDRRLYDAKVRKLIEESIMNDQTLDEFKLNDNEKKTTTTTTTINSRIERNSSNNK